MTDSPTRADLLPCPFCGGEAKHYHHTPTGIMNTDHIECDNCSNGTCLHETKAEAVTAWNTRAPTAERIAALEGEVERLRGNVRGWVEWHSRYGTYLNDGTWRDAEALQSTGIGLLARAALKGIDHDPA